MDDYPDYHFTCSQAAQYEWIEHGHPALFERIRDKVAAGQWHPVGGMWVEPDMNLPSGESIVRQLVLGQRYFESKFGMRSSVIWIPDVFGYPASLPQIFRAGRVLTLRHPEAELEQAERVPALDVLVGGPRRLASAHPLPAGRHLQRRDHRRPRCATPRATSRSTAGATGR